MQRQPQTAPPLTPKARSSEIRRARRNLDIDDDPRAPHGGSVDRRIGYCGWLAAAAMACSAEGSLSGDPVADHRPSSDGGGAGSDSLPSDGGASAGGDPRGHAGGTEWQPGHSDFCGEGYAAIDDATCFYAPADVTASPGVLLFLHGMLPPDASAATMMALARGAADTHGVVVLFPRGEPGLCSWDASVEDWYCWPTSRAAVDAHAAAMVARFDAATALLEDHLGVDLSARHLLGFSNGGYFASFLALEGWWAPLTGAGLVAAGRAFVDTSLLSTDRPPMYIAVGALDIQTVQDSAHNLAYVLSLEAWPHDLVIHPDSGHQLSAADFTLAWSLWHP